MTILCVALAFAKSNQWDWKMIFDVIMCRFTSVVLFTKENNRVSIDDSQLQLCSNPFLLFFAILLAIIQNFMIYGKLVKMQPGLTSALCDVGSNIMISTSTMYLKKE
ncbi:hypothetical protein CSX00_04910 [Pseudobutyrivibrio ruminis]|uniref:Uncharacterized protein n=1 Tax=Pseudobutyrivibrio ruminis TaxID=46206 RepID=A0A2G3EBN2_9FIRM|nr:hypothetical protein CSX00_04910 [Pseudobutyrivibrio ruminis]